MSIIVRITKYYNFLEKAFKFGFTTLDGKEETGPTSTSGYAGTSLDGKVTLSNGIQIWSVPVTGRYIIEAFGASGANGTDFNQSEWRIGGLGAKMEGTLTLVKGTKLKILIGQEGNRGADFGDNPGGGGTFVTLLDDTPLIIAGGGGGGGIPKKQFEDGDPGQATENGTRCGGTRGNGGQPCNSDTGNVDSGILSGGGAGLKGNGGGGRSGGAITSSLSFINGGTGGTCPASNGGFGGGSFGFVMGGGGGGYSGGGVVGSSSSGVAGGGGSYNIGTNQQNKAGVNKGDGKVIITLKN